MVLIPFTSCNIRSESVPTQYNLFIYFETEHSTIYIMYFHLHPFYTKKKYSYIFSKEARIHYKMECSTILTI